VRKPTPNEQLRTLRKFRNTPKRDLTINAEVERFRKQYARQAGALGGLDELWTEVAPPELCAVAKLVKLTPGGVLHIEAADSSACFEVDQWKRGGGLAVLRSKCAVTLKDVRVSVKRSRQK